MIITCHRSHLEERCLQRGYSLFRAAGCVVSSSGDMLAVDTDHVDYPAERVGVLGFKCVPDCTDLQFLCGSGECCVELPDGSNGCQACSSSSSSSSVSGSSSSSACNIGGLNDGNSVKCCLYVDQMAVQPPVCYTSVTSSVCDDCPSEYNGLPLYDQQISDINLPCFDWESCAEEVPDVGCCCFDGSPSYWIDGASSCNEFGGIFFPSLDFCSNVVCPASIG